MCCWSSASWGTLLPLLPYDDWWIRGGDYPRVQFALLMLLGLVLLGFGYRGLEWTLALKVVMFGGAACIIFQLLNILPYTPLWKKQAVDAPPNPAAEDHEFHLLISNVLQSNTRYDDLVQLVISHEPDLLLTLETNATWQRELEQRLPPGYDYSIKVPLENRYGMHLYSRLPLRQENVMHLISDEIPSIYTEVQLRSGEWIKLYGLHPTPPSPTEESASTARDAELGLVGMRIKDSGNQHTVVAGDLNDVAWSHSTRLFQRLSGLLDPRRGRGLFASFHAEYWFARWPLDHVFHSDEFQVVWLKRMQHIGSDHFPVAIRLRHLPARDEEQDAPQEEQGDRAEAHETVKTAKEGDVDGLIVD